MGGRDGLDGVCMDMTIYIYKNDDFCDIWWMMDDAPSPLRKGEKKTPVMQHFPRTIILFRKKKERENAGL